MKLVLEYNTVTEKLQCRRTKYRGYWKVVRSKEIIRNAENVLLRRK